MISFVRDLGIILSYLMVGGMFGKEAHDFMRDQALLKVSQGFPSFTKMSESLTCIRYDEQWNPHRIMKGHCKKYWRKHEHQ